jgi:rhodanese-related sulfurtransferase
LIRQLSATEIRDRLQAADDAPFLLDVREPQEFAYRCMDGVAARAREVDPSKKQY